jgi:hypothetical protein
LVSLGFGGAWPPVWLGGEGGVCVALGTVAFVLELGIPLLADASTVVKMVVAFELAVIDSVALP